jgi:protein TonB
MKSHTSLHLLVWATSIVSSPIIASTAISIEDAAKRGLIKLIIKGKGGYTGKVIELKIKNNTPNNLNLKLEAGRRLDSKDNTQQDILVTQAQEFYVYGNQQKNMNVNGMCCQASNTCPKANSDYLVGKMADSNLVKLASFIDQNKYYPTMSRRLGQTGTVVIAFTLLEDGNIVNVRIDSPSAYERLNASALDAVRKVERFKPIPKEVGENKMDIKVPVKFVTI